jgi:hypothetical protein
MNGSDEDAFFHACSELVHVTVKKLKPSDPLGPQISDIHNSQWELLGNWGGMSIMIHDDRHYVQPASHQFHSRPSIV